ncbi:MAG: DUF3810 domain-containing protein [Planctomycetes bacterium]|nr:DUF3810 domain-containing protein [Planctomycetota bacterium]
MGNTGEETQALHGQNDQPLPIGVFALFTPDEAMPKDRGLYVKRRGIVILAGLLVVVGAWGVAQSPQFVENVYAQGVSPLLTRGLSAATGFLATSVAELLMLLAGLWVLLPALYAFYNIARRRRRMLNALACGTLRGLMLASVTVALFYLFWGVNYARAPLVQRLDWTEHSAQPKDAEAQREELQALCEALVQAANDSYLAAFSSKDIGRPSAPLTDDASLDAGIDEGLDRAAEDLKLDEAFRHSHGRAKPVALSSLMSRFQIAGFYSPWTGEANFNMEQPGHQLPLSIAHEKCHQRGVTSEDEANFLGFAACVRADDPYVRYAGYLFAQRQLLGELLALDGEAAGELVAQRLPGVQRDVDTAREFWLRHEGALAEASHAVNDAYLKTNGVQAGVRSYGASAQLLVVYARKQGGIVPSGKVPGH